MSAARAEQRPWGGWVNPAIDTLLEKKSLTQYCLVGRQENGRVYAETRWGGHTSRSRDPQHSIPLELLSWLTAGCVTTNKNGNPEINPCRRRGGGATVYVFISYHSVISGMLPFPPLKKKTSWQKTGAHVAFSHLSVKQASQSNDQHRCTSRVI